MPEKEELIGTRHMLFQSSDMESPIKIQWCHVSEKEIIDVTNYLILNNIGYPTESCDFTYKDREAYDLNEYENRHECKSEDDAEDVIDESVLGKRLINCLDRLGVTVQLVFPFFYFII